MNSRIGFALESFSVLQLTVCEQRAAVSSLSTFLCILSTHLYLCRDTIVM